jgi:hypothetical protein
MTKGSIGRLLSAAFVAGAFSVVTFAQDTAGTAGQAGQRADADRDRMVTVTGCLRAERDVPGRDEGLFQRWGLTQQDYVLTNVQRGQHQTGQAGQAGQPGQAGQTGQYGQAQQPGQTGTQAGQAGTQAGQDRQVGTAGAMRPAATNMLRLEGKDADQLRQYANQRVEIRGTIEQTDRAWFDRTFGEDHGRTAGQPGTAGTQAGTQQPDTQPGAGVGTTGQQPTGTAGATGDDRLRSIEVESIRPIGSC